MKRGLYMLLAAVLAGLAGFVITRQQCECDCAIPAGVVTHDGEAQLPELAWLHREFQLTDEQFSKVSALHLAYRPTCEVLCAKVMASHEKVRRLVAAGTQVSPDITAALQEHAALHVECQTAMLAHLYQTAACMSPAQAQHYLDATVPQVIEMAMEPGAKQGGH